MKDYFLYIGIVLLLMIIIPLIPVSCDDNNRQYNLERINDNTIVHFRGCEKNVEFWKKNYDIYYFIKEKNYKYCTFCFNTYDKQMFNAISKRNKFIKKQMIDLDDTEYNNQDQFDPR